MISPRYFLHIPHAAKPDVRGRAVRRVAGTRVSPVTIAVARVAEIRTASHHAALAGGGADWIFARRRAVIGGIEPVPAPFPHVSGSLIQAVTVRLVTLRRGGAVESVG